MITQVQKALQYMENSHLIQKQSCKLLKNAVIKTVTEYNTFRPHDLLVLIRTYRSLTSQCNQYKGIVNNYLFDPLLKTTVQSLQENLSIYQNVLRNIVCKIIEAIAQINPVVNWSLSIYGVGHIAAAVLYALLQIPKTKSIGSAWRYFGCAPGYYQGYNKHGKWLSWFLGQYFQFYRKHPECYYGKIINYRFQYETLKNEAGDYKEYAEKYLNIIHPNRRSYHVYKTGKLPYFHLVRRARRYAFKIFLSHYYILAYAQYYHKIPTSLRKDEQFFINATCCYQIEPPPLFLKTLKSLLPENDDSWKDIVYGDYDDS